MPLYFIKPVVWNDQGYRKPAGMKYTSGYPADNGFGHEEWNHSARLTVQYHGETIHIFHTEGFKKKNLDTHPGQIFVFMIASNEGRQFLVGIAGNATALMADKHRKERLKLLNLISDSKILPQEAWATSTVRKAFRNREAEFYAKWRDERHWFANWHCPADVPRAGESCRTQTDGNHRQEQIHYDVQLLSGN